MSSSSFMFSFLLLVLFMDFVGTVSSDYTFPGKDLTGENVSKIRRECIKDIPNDWTNPLLNAYCRRCNTCHDPMYCSAYYACEYNHVSYHTCSKFKNVTDGCCPKCDCYHNGKEMPIGSSWVAEDRLFDRKYRWHCGNDRIAYASEISCPFCDGDEVPQPGQVCGKCVPKKCKIDGIVYNANDTIFISNDLPQCDNPMFTCKVCKCSGRHGTPRDCIRERICFIPPSKYVPRCSKYKAVPGKCCPVCDCYHNGKTMPKGSSWFVKHGFGCSKCTCSNDGIAKCGIAFPCLPCPPGMLEIQVPGQCCSKCILPPSFPPLPPHTPPR